MSGIGILNLLEHTSIYSKWIDTNFYIRTRKGNAKLDQTEPSTFVSINSLTKYLEAIELLPPRKLSLKRMPYKS
jgi:hypothetical protein